MKRAVKWTLTDMDMSTSIDRRPDRKEQVGQCRPRKVQWLTSTALFMTNCMVENVATYIEKCRPVEKGSG